MEDAGVDADIGKGGQNEPPDAGVFIALECGERWRKPNASVGRGARTGPIGAHLAERAGAELREITPQQRDLFDRRRYYYAVSICIYYPVCC